MAATSYTLRAIGPAVSKESASGTMPSRLSRPRVGFRPAMPFEVVGPRTDPPVSVPMPSWANQAAMATPVPPDDPEGVRVGLCGLSIGPSIELRATPDANSLMFALPRMIAPAPRSLCTMKASSGGIDPLSRSDPAVVGMSWVSTLSLSTTGIPCRSERGPVSRRSRSRARAVSRARGLRVRKALRRGPSSS